MRSPISSYFFYIRFRTLTSLLETNSNAAEESLSLSHHIIVH